MSVLVADSALLRTSTATEPSLACPGLLFFRQEAFNRLHHSSFVVVEAIGLHFFRMLFQSFDIYRRFVELGAVVSAKPKCDLVRIGHLHECQLLAGDLRNVYRGLCSTNERADHRENQSQG